MDRGLPDSATVGAAVALAVRAPSVHNTQPWRWRAGDRTLHLYTDLERRVPVTDPQGRDLLVSCGAALHHVRVAFAALGWRAEVHRLPNPADPTHLASIELSRHEPSERDVVMATAISRRRTDRRRYSSWPVPPQELALLTERAADEATLLRPVEGSAAAHLTHAIQESSAKHGADPAYLAELALWSGRHAAGDGVPSNSVPAPGTSPGALPGRPFADPGLRQPPGSETDADEAELLVLGTTSDDRMSQLRAGEATSAVLLTATTLGLASCPLTEPLELPGTRETLRAHVTAGAYPQMVLRVGWAPVSADPLPASPRRDIAEVLSPLGDPARS